MPRSDPGLIRRVGLAVARPRWALALADDPGAAGRAGSDLTALLALVILCVHTRALVAAGWLAGVVDVAVGGRALLSVMARAVTTPLAFVLGAALVIVIAAGRRRSLGRAFDLACVAVLPLILVEVAATLVVRALGLTPSAAGQFAILLAGAGWTGALVVLAVLQARRPRARDGEAVAHLPPGSRRLGARAGGAVAAVTAGVLVVNAVWIAGHLDWLRPMTAGDRVPAFALRRIEAGGALGAPVSDRDLAGQVVLIDFWATWCGPCLQALPPLQALAARGRVTVLSVNLDDAAKARAMLDAEGFTAPILVADDEATSERFGVSTIPHLVVVDRAGVVRMVSRGEGNLRRVIAEAEQLAR